MRKLPSLLAAATLGATVLTAAGGSAAAGPGFAPHTDTFGGNWAGYAASGQTFTSITGSWTEPQATCTARHDLYAPWVGLDGYNDRTVEQTGVQTSCSTGTPVDSGWYEMYPAAPRYYSNPVSTGDTITATVTYQGGTSYSLTLKDVTKGWSHTVTKSLSARNASAEAVIEAPGGFPGLPSGVTFNNVTVNGKLLSTFSPVKLTSARFRPGPLSGGTFTVKHT
jgi:Peptidase A4 family